MKYTYNEVEQIRKGCAKQISTAGWVGLVVGFIAGAMVGSFLAYYSVAQIML